MSTSLTPAPRRAATLAFVTAFVTLASQVLVHRMVQAKLLNNLAFLIISLTMLGFALSGVILTRLLPRLLRNFGDAMVLCASLYAVTMMGAAALFYRAPAGALGAGTRAEFVAGFLQTLPLALLYALPFTFSGLMLGALLSAPELDTRRVYFWDLLGSATGAFAVLPAITHLGVEKSVMAACGLLLAASLVLTPARSRSGRALAGAAALALAASAVFEPRVFALRYPAGSMLGSAEERGIVVEHVAWDPISRIEVSRIPPLEPGQIDYPCLIGDNRAFHARIRRMLTQNNYAFTLAVDYDGRRESLTGIEETIYAAAYVARTVPRPRVLVIGVGGGFDILTALYFDATEVTGAEVNGATLRVLTRTFRDYFATWVGDPRVRLVHGEGRHVLASADARYDVLQLSGVDSYSGTPAAAHVFSENYLYTAEAFDLYLSRLTDVGILNVMRLEFQPPREMLRALTTAVAALRRAGARRPADHVVMVSATEGNFTAMLIKKAPFTEAEKDRLEAWAQASPYFEVTAAPWRSGRRGLYQAFLNLGTAAHERAFAAQYPFAVAPVSDDRPFFFHYSFWGDLFPSAALGEGSVPVMELSLVMLLLLIGGAAVFCVFVPLRWLASAASPGEGTWRHAIYFAGAGLGYLAIEIALLQKFGLFLGHPNHALSVVLAAMLLTTGLGSLFSGRIMSVLGGPRFVAYFLSGTILAVQLLVLPRLPPLMTLSLSARGALVLALIAPIGALLGTFVPTGLDALKLQNPRFVPWAWGLNGIASVLAPVLSIALSVTFGMTALLLSAIPVYLAVGWSFRPPGHGGLAPDRGPGAPREENH